jgi:hypothetical protein
MEGWSRGVGIVRRCAWAALALLALAGADPAGAREREMIIETVAVMPFGSWIGENASIDVDEYLAAGIVGQGFRLVAAADLEAFLVAHRIRRPDFLDRAAIRGMGTDLRADALLMGFADILAGEGDVQVSLSAQLVDCHEASVIWANAVAVAGSDFETVLGLGRVTAVEDLLRMAVARLLERVPRSAVLEGSRVSPYEIIRASFSPDTLRAGAAATLSVEVKEAAQGLRDIKAFLQEKEIVMHSDDGRWYSGRVSAPEMEGAYPLKLYVTDEENRVFTVSDVAMLTVHNTPPEVFVVLRQKAFSPNDDGVEDQMVLVPESRSAGGLRSWRLVIATPDGAVVRDESGTTRLPEAFIWTGQDGRGAPVPDGTYVCRLEVEDLAGNVSAASGPPVVLDTTAPDAKVVLDPGSKRLEAAVADLSGVRTWTLTLYGESGAETRLQGAGNVPAVLDCPPGEWTDWSLAAEDLAGNRLRPERKPLPRKQAVILEQDLRDESKKRTWDVRF